MTEFEIITLIISGFAFLLSIIIPIILQNREKYTIRLDEWYRTCIIEALEKAKQDINTLEKNKISNKIKIKKTCHYLSDSILLLKVFVNEKEYKKIISLIDDAEETMLFALFKNGVYDNYKSEFYINIYKHLVYYSKKIKFPTIKKPLDWHGIQKEK